MKDIIKKIFKPKINLLFSDKCYCKNDCNKVIMFYELDKNTIEVVIDWKISKEKPKKEDNSTSVIIKRKYLLDNLIKASGGISKLEEFDYALQYYENRYLNEKKIKKIDSLENFKNWITINIKKKYEQ